MSGVVAVMVAVAGVGLSRGVGVCLTGCAVREHGGPAFARRGFRGVGTICRVRWRRGCGLVRKGGPGGLGAGARDGSLLCAEREVCRAAGPQQGRRDGCVSIVFAGGCGWFPCMVAGTFLRGCADCLEQEKGIRWMPWHQEAMKDVARCEKPWGAASRL